MASVAESSPEKGRKMAPRVSMLTPGIAPKTRPPNSPAKKMPMLVGLLTSVSVPCRKCSIFQRSPAASVQLRSSTTSQLLKS